MLTPFWFVEHQPRHPFLEQLCHRRNVNILSGAYSWVWYCVVFRAVGSLPGFCFGPCPEVTAGVHVPEVPQGTLFFT